ncbi:MAG: hypothetical protein JSW27_24045 [Phycisphaerales bacterium]|nr:MAG: hypothetical protein JSW27_24045 [Phycisphaerales bacterium]
MERYRSACMAVAVCALIAAPGSVIRAKYGGGQGTAEDPFLIGTAEQLCAIGADPNDWDCHFRLTADIDLSKRRDTAFSPIGSRRGSLGWRPYTGVFDGAGHTIRNLTYVSDETYPAGLFGHVAGGAELSDLTLVGPMIDAPNGAGVGALVGSLGDATVTGCRVDGASVRGRSSVGGLVGAMRGSLSGCSCTGEVTGDHWVGGLVGQSERGTLTDCRSAVRVEGQALIGGLVGSNEYAGIESCHSEGTVVGARHVGGLLGSNKGKVISSYSMAAIQGTDEGAGGLVGYNSGTITSCWASGAVEGNQYVGGLAGVGGGTITHCYATGAVQGQMTVGGFSGTNWGRIMLCYATGIVSGDENVGGFAPGGSTFLCYWDTETSGVARGGAGWGRTTTQMQTAATFAGWGYESQWCLDEGLDYPRLAWEGTRADLLVDAVRTYGGGTGEPHDPYLIATAEQLISLARYREDFDKHFRLASDIDLASAPVEELMPIGIAGSVFSGSFDGDGHAILHLVCHGRTQGDAGLFGSVGGNGLVRDLRLENAELSCDDGLGALASYNAGRVLNCSVTGIIQGLVCTGGLVGYNSGRIEASFVDVQVTGQSSVGGLVGCNVGRIETCGAAGRVTGQSSVGGLVGRNDKEIFASRSAAEVSGEEDVGGLVGAGGQAQRWLVCPAPPPSYVPGLSDSRITACYCIGSVSGRAAVGGLVGQNAGIILGCYAACPVRSVSDSADTRSPADVGIGGLVGTNDYGIVHSSYWDMEGSGLLRSSGGRGRATSQMVYAETFRGWEDQAVWVIDEGRDYPRLAWEESAGTPLVAEPLCNGGGTGLPDDPYQIWTVEDLVNMGYYPSDWSRHFVLMTDLDLGQVAPNTMWPVGILSVPFSGVFDGQGFTLAHFTCLRDRELYAGLFGSIGQNPAEPSAPAGAVVNLNLEDVDVTGFVNVGALSGHNAGTVSSCSVTGRVIAHGKNAGGLIGYNVGRLADCVVDCNVTSEEVVGTLAAYSGGPVTGCSGAGIVTTLGERNSYAGGLIGENGDVLWDSHFTGLVLGKYAAGGLVALNEGTIQHCSAHATVSGTYLLGGLVGYNEYSRVIEQSFAESVIVGGNSVGGLVGYNDGQIRNCLAGGEVIGEARVGGLVGHCQRELMFSYSTCSVSGQESVGGLVGELRWGEIISCFWDLETSGCSDGLANVDPDPAGVTGLMTPGMKKQATFTSAGWDFIGETENGIDDIWFIAEGLDYPRLVGKTAYEADDEEEAGRPTRSR